MDRPNRGFGRGYSQGNDVRAQRASTDRPQPDRQEEDWSTPATVERREEMERHETLQASPPDVPPPKDERVFTDWSSIDSPRVRVTQCSQSARSVEPNITVIQTEQPTIGLEESEVLDYILSDVMTIPSTHQQISLVGARFVDREINTSEVETRPQREEMRIDIKHTHNKGVQVPTSHSNLSSHDVDIDGDSPARLHIPDVMLQLDGPASIHARRRPVQEFTQRTAAMPRVGYPE